MRVGNVSITAASVEASTEMSKHNSAITHVPGHEYPQFLFCYSSDCRWPNNCNGLGNVSEGLGGIMPCMQSRHNKIQEGGGR
jgi:hypothetical protein